MRFDPVYSVANVRKGANKDSIPSLHRTNYHLPPYYIIRGRNKVAKTKKPVLSILRKEPTSHRPVWLMRQAGRFLPEYRSLRAEADSFLSFCLNSDLATEATLQPIRRFNPDAAIVFADILLVPFAMDQDLSFQEGEGPVLNPIRSSDHLANLAWDVEKLEPVFETITRVKKELPKHVAMLGFAGSPWTVAAYMIEGRGKAGFPNALKAARENSDFIEALLDLLFRATLEYLGRQIEAGAEAIQLFDSWAGLLDDQGFRSYVIEPTTRLVEALHSEYPGVPVIGFPRGARLDQYKAYATETGVDAMGIDEHIPLGAARLDLQPLCPLQGNLDPRLLVIGGEPMQAAIRAILKSLGPLHIFNLGHGVTPDTSPDHVAEMIRQVRAYRSHG